MIEKKKRFEKIPTAILLSVKKKIFLEGFSFFSMVYLLVLGAIIYLIIVNIYVFVLPFI